MIYVFWILTQYSGINTLSLKDNSNKLQTQTEKNNIKHTTKNTKHLLS